MRVRHAIPVLLGVLIVCAVPCGDTWAKSGSSSFGGSRSSSGTASRPSPPRSVAPSASRQSTPASRSSSPPKSYFGGSRSSEPAFSSSKKAPAEQAGATNKAFDKFRARQQARKVIEQHERPAISNPPSDIRTAVPSAPLGKREERAGSGAVPSDREKPYTTPVAVPPTPPPARPDREPDRQWDYYPPPSPTIVIVPSAPPVPAPSWPSDVTRHVPPPQPAAVPRESSPHIGNAEVRTGSIWGFVKILLLLGAVGGCIAAVFGYRAHYVDVTTRPPNFSLK